MSGPLHSAFLAFAGGEDGRLLAAAQRGDPTAVVAALAAGASRDCSDLSPLSLFGVLWRGWTSVHYAACNGNAAALAALLDGGCAADQHAADGTTPLKAAAAKGSAACTELLLARGAAVDGRDRYCATALHYSCYYGHVACVSKLLSAGADVNASTTQGGGLTPLLICARFRQPACAALLLAAGADVTARGADGRTAAESAADDATRALLAAAAAPSRPIEPASTAG